MIFRIGLAALLSLSLVVNTNADTHKAFVGREGAPDVIYTLEFDDEALTLELAANTSTPVPAGFLALSGDKSTLYSTNQGKLDYGGGEEAASQPILTSYSIDADGNLAYTGDIYATNDNLDSFGSGNWAGANPASPYNVHLVSLGIGVNNAQTIISVDSNGTINAAEQIFEYGSNSYLHGGAFHPTSKWIYIFDVDQNMIFTYSIDNSTGQTTYLANYTLPYPVDGPRHGVVHPNGEKLYLVTENSNHLAQYNIDLETGLPSSDGVYYSMLQEGQNASSYWCGEVNLSPSGELLWGANRGRSANLKGSVSLFTLDNTGSIEEQKFFVNTSTSGGLANLVSSVLFSDRYFALPDLEVGFVEMWELAGDNSTATVIAHLDLPDGGCCENVVWWS